MPVQFIKFLDVLTFVFDNYLTTFFLLKLLKKQNVGSFCQNKKKKNKKVFVKMDSFIENKPPILPLLGV